MSSDKKDSRAAAEIQRLEILKTLDKGAFDLWKHFDGRASDLKRTFWTTGIWLVALLGATLSLAFKSDFVSLSSDDFSLHVKSTIPLLFVAGFGVLSSVYALNVIHEIKRHIEMNWQRADYCRDKLWREAHFNSYDWKLLLLVIATLLSAFLFLMVNGVLMLFLPQGIYS